MGKGCQLQLGRFNLGEEDCHSSHGLCLHSVEQCHGNPNSLSSIEKMGTMSFNFDLTINQKVDETGFQLSFRDGAAICFLKTLTCRKFHSLSNDIKFESFGALKQSEFAENVLEIPKAGLTMPPLTFSTINERWPLLQGGFMEI